MGSWNLGKRFKIFLLALALALLLGLISACVYIFIGERMIESGAANISTTDLHYNLDNCEKGDSGYVRIADTAMNLTVQGLETYRGRQVCHSSGDMTVSGERFKIDIYRIEKDDQCTVLVSYEDPSDTGEKCEGHWPD